MRTIFVKNTEQTHRYIIFQITFKFFFFNIIIIFTVFHCLEILIVAILFALKSSSIIIIQLLNASRNQKLFCFVFTVIGFLCLRWVCQKRNFTSPISRGVGMSLDFCYFRDPDIFIFIIIFHKLYAWISHRCTVIIITFPYVIHFLL